MFLLGFAIAVPDLRANAICIAKTLQCNIYTNKHRFFKIHQYSITLICRLGSALSESQQADEILGFVPHTSLRIAI